MQVRRLAASGMRDALFFAAFAIYVWAGIDPRLIYHWQGPVFSTIPGFAAEFFTRPGGPADYCMRLLAQAFASRAWGTLVIAALAAAVAALTHILLTRLAGRNLSPAESAARLLLPVLFLPLLSQYSFATPILLIAILTLALAVALQSVTRLPVWVWLALAVLALAVAWGVAGTPGLALTPVAAVVFLRRGRAPLSPIRVHPALAAGAIFLCLAVAAVWSDRHNSRDRRLTALDYFTLREDWPAVLESARNLPATDFNSLTRYEINLALHESHRLGDEMFHFPQKTSLLLALRADPFFPYTFRVTDLCIRLGRTAEAERFASEAMLLRDRDPLVYRQLADIQVVRGRPEASQKFLNVLSYDASSGAWARARLRALALDPLLTADPALQQFRRRTIQSDDMIPVWQRPDRPEADMERLLRDQLDQDPTNRAAFEFLAGNYLLANDLVSFHALLPRMASISGPEYGTPGVRRTPIHFQEALAIYENGTGAPTHIEGTEVLPETRRRFEEFKRTVRQYVTREAAMQSVWRDYRTTYFFYFTFGPGDYR